MESGCFRPSLGPLKHLIADTQYHSFAYTDFTVCLLLLKDGKGLIGLSDLPVKDSITEQRNAAALEDALTKLIRLRLDQTDADLESASPVSCVPIKAVDDTKLN